LTTGATQSRTNGMQKSALRITGMLLVSLGVLLIPLTILQSKLIFFPETLPNDHAFYLAPGEEEVFIDTEDGERINGIWSHVDQSQGLVLYFHGNAGSLESWKGVARDFNGLGYEVLIIDYRGYGKSSGVITEEGLYEDAKATWNFALARGVPASSIVIYGRSIGSGPAAELALHASDARALILETPFTSLLSLAKSIYPFLLPDLTLRFRFETDQKLPLVKMPILMVHGTQDEIIPVSHSQELQNLLGTKSTLVIIDGANHNNVSAYPAYEDALRDFLNLSTQ